MNITPEATCAAVQEIKERGNPDIELGHFVQLAINAAVAEKDREIQDRRNAVDRLLLQNASLVEQRDNLCDERGPLTKQLAEKDREIERLKRPPCSCADWGMTRCTSDCDSNKTWPDILNERDTLTKQLAELREIAEGLAKEWSIVAFEMHGIKTTDALTSYTQWKEKNDK